MNPLLLAAILALHAPPALPVPLLSQPSVKLALDGPPREAPPARLAVMPRAGTRVLARRRPGG